MAEVPVVKVKSKEHEDGFKVINKSDFDPEVHEKYEGEPSQLEKDTVTKRPYRRKE